jgi:hypothetical protein
MKKKILTITVCMLFFTTVFMMTGLASQKIITDEKSTNFNSPPNPPIIEGPESGKIKETYTYNFTVIDPDEDLLETLEIQWGDGEVTEVCAGCTGPRWESGTTQYVEHRWKKSGDFRISARVMDVYGEWSEWSDPYSVTMPKSNHINNWLFLQILNLLPKIVNLLNL